MIYIKFFITFIFIILISKQIDLNNLNISKINYPFLLVSFIFFFIFHIFRIYRWREIAVNFNSKIKENFIVVYFVGFAMGTITPGRLGDFYKVSFLTRNKWKIVFYEKICDLKIIGIYLIAYLFYYFSLLNINYVIFLYLFLLILNFFFEKKFFSKHSFFAWNNFSNLLITLFSYISYIIATIFIYKSLNTGFLENENLSVFIGAIILSIIAALIPLSIAGIGFRDYAFFFLVKDIVSFDISILITFFILFLSNIVFSIIGLLFFIYKPSKNTYKRI